MPGDGLVLLDTAAPRAGRRFAPVQELDLVEDGLTAAAGLPSAHRGLSVVSEMTGPIGIPDLVACVGGAERLAERRAVCVPPILNQADAAILAAAAFGRGRHLDTLVRALGWEHDFVARRVLGLARAGALIRGDDGYRRTAGIQPLGRIYAIETKVSDWRQAVRQARSYRVWSDAYVVVMGKLGTTALDRVTDAVESDGGGLMVSGRWVLRPSIGPISPGHRLWGSEFVFAALGGRDQS